MRFVDGQCLRQTVRRAGRRKDDAPQSGIQQLIEQAEGIDDVVLEILARRLNRFADIGKRGEVDHRFDSLFAQRLPQQGAVGEITFSGPQRTAQ